MSVASLDGAPPWRLRRGGPRGDCHGSYPSDATVMWA